MESLINYIKKFPYLFGILIGLLFILAAIFKWNWILNNNSSNFMIGIYEMFGEIGVRILTGILGSIIIISCIVIWIIRK
ncbi:Imm17 family immunity protein [Brachyspira intermedia]|uniref:Imm17 family immunity protein n=1 Tax=Brachyspira intermedia TaxID=84377 RepID=UPI00300615AD